MFSVYRIPDLSDILYDCLFTATAKVQYVHGKASFLFVFDFNCHHEERLQSSATNLQGRGCT